ncbi:pilus assembly protein PilW [Ferrimonas sediminicola]|uniref:Pilus assembly protein PilW n=1 Tax=Ferrimonas sediminicola TaxID=2569538 RepID=A0A4U1BCX4_9GAMM|nr:PilW family protein [Ferrimonas sediminicola]TKB48780.1 pilus assembly protein PilW [Ferrimonas sediminicola]
MKRGVGATLVELLIAMILGLFLLGSVLGVFVASSSSVSRTGQYNQLQESARLALSLLGEELAQAGFWADLTGDSLNLDSVQVLASVANDCVGEGDNNASMPALRGHFRYLWAYRQDTTPNMSCSQGAVEGSHVVQIKRASGPPREAAELESNRYYLLANASRGILFAGDRAPVPTLTQGRYWEFQHRVFYVERREDGVPVLKWRQLYVNGGMVEEELVEGVETLQIRLGVDSDGDGSVDSYLPPSALSPEQWEGEVTLVSVSLFLVVRAPVAEPLSQDTLALTLPDGVLGYSDGLPRRLFSTTVMLRNPVLILRGAL